LTHCSTSLTISSDKGNCSCLGIRPQSSRKCEKDEELWGLSTRSDVTSVGGNRPKISAFLSLGLDTGMTGAAEGVDMASAHLLPATWQCFMRITSCLLPRCQPPPDPSKTSCQTQNVKDFQIRILFLALAVITQSLAILVPCLVGRKSTCYNERQLPATRTRCSANGIR
jgi:hypothetical protein